jgi:aminopeptidase-like protein
VVEEVAQDDRESLHSRSGYSMVVDGFGQFTDKEWQVIISTCFESSVYEYAPKIHRPDVEGEFCQPSELSHAQLHTCHMHEEPMVML